MPPCIPHAANITDAKLPYSFLSGDAAIVWISGMQWAALLTGEIGVATGVPGPDPGALPSDLRWRPTAFPPW